MSTTESSADVNQNRLSESLIENVAADIDSLEDTVSEVAIQLHKLMEHQLDKEAVLELVFVEVRRQLRPLQATIDEMQEHIDSMQEQLDAMSGKIVAIQSDIKPVPKDYF